MQGHLITGTQIRAARGALNWSVKQLADRAGVGTATIARYEEASCVPKSRKGNLKKLRAVFEAAGIEFIGTPDDRPGIRIASLDR
jgi:transcriptional regulator with XRE-family HTH domain